jgi:methylthioribose-1-phosphate isomerase
MPIPETVAWTSAGLRVLDQSLLPGEERYPVLTTVAAVAAAIRDLQVRGAPLIGIVGAMGVALSARLAGTSDPDAVLAAVEAAGAELRATRPTAVNLAWAIDRMLVVARAASSDRGLATRLEAEALAIHAEDRAMCDAIGRHGLNLVPDHALVLTHCNAGSLATGGIGTALAPVYAANAEGRHVSVIADETRPVLQGSRLTAWELTRAGIPVTVIADGMAASRLRKGDVTCVIVGADRIAANGDTANKIGTYPLALAAHAHDVPFYVAAPVSTFDAHAHSGTAIPIEERNPSEITTMNGRRVAPEGVAVWNPAFDVTPAHLITGFITDRGLLQARELRTALVSHA